MKQLLIVIGGIFVCGFIFYGAIFCYQLSPRSVDAMTVSTIVNQGDSFQSIADNLESLGLIRSSSGFKLYCLIRGWANKLKPGAYDLSQSLSAKKIARIIYEGPAGEISVTIPEGWTLSTIERKLKNDGVLPENEYLAYVKVSDFQDKNSDYYFSFLDDVPSEMNLEGFLFPDTYRFEPSSSAMDVAVRFLTNFKNKFSEEFISQMKQRGLDYYDIVKMASLIEVEVANPNDRAKVSGILWKRLDNSMPLQVDATIIYIKCEINRLLESKVFSAELCRTISKEDLKIKSLYNTYLHKGLPYGPISNPGLSAIESALYSEKTSYWYYLSDPKTGKTIFSKTLEEHNVAKAKYIK